MVFSRAHDLVQVVVRRVEHLRLLELEDPVGHEEPTEHQDLGAR